MFVIPDGNALVDYIKDFTGSTNDQEIKNCIFLAELSMRNVELPALRSDPYAPENIGIADAEGYVPIPADMNKPILFFKQGNPGGEQNSQTGPWIVYDRIGDRDIITQGMIAQLYLSPVNVPAVIRGKFSEVYNKYHFLPWIGEGAQINMYYYKAWPLLFAPAEKLISTTGTVGSIAGSGPWTAAITGMTSNADLDIGDTISAVPGTGTIGGGSGVYTVASKPTTTSITFTAVGGTTPTAGTVTDIYALDKTVETNAVLQTWPEGYVYATLREYYIKRHNSEDAAVYGGKFDNAFDQVEDQNNKGKWSGGHTRFTSVWQPRQYRQYNIK